MLEKVSQIVLLKDFYGPLLTEKQQAILNLYYENDFSLSEIANDMNISRQAVYDLVKRAEHQLQQYEEKLGLVEKFQRTRSQLELAHGLLDSDEINLDRVQRATRILQELGELL